MRLVIWHDKSIAEMIRMDKDVKNFSWKTLIKQLLIKGYGSGDDTHSKMVLALAMASFIGINFLEGFNIRKGA